VRNDSIIFEPVQGTLVEEGNFFESDGQCKLRGIRQNGAGSIVALNAGEKCFLNDMGELEYGVELGSEYLRVCGKISNLNQ
jgi:hypothetical protein